VPNFYEKDKKKYRAAAGEAGLLVWHQAEIDCTT
jgi:hypothetical protein